jgi:hypothetical protein
MNSKQLRSLSSKELLRSLSEVLRRSRRVESELVAHIGEVDARRLFVEEASPSMFAYCVSELRLSEGETYVRIAAARASRKYPELLTMLEKGEPHLTGVGLLVPHLDKLDDAERKSVLGRAKHKTKREIKEFIAELAPRPDVPPIIRKLTDKKSKELRPKPSTSVDTQLRPDAVGSAKVTESAQTFTGPRSEPPEQTHEKGTEAEAEAKAKRPVVEPLSPARYKIQFTANAELKNKIERLAALMPGVELAELIDAAVTEKLERVEANRYGKVKKPRTSVADTDASSVAREPVAAVKRAVCESDRDQCTYVSPSGKRCPVRDGLEFHHIQPHAKGGPTTVGNLTLRCRTHNLHAAELDFGVETMRRYRSGADRVGEPGPGWPLRPDAVEFDVLPFFLGGAAVREWRGRMRGAIVAGDDYAQPIDYSASQFSTLKSGTRPK